MENIQKTLGGWFIAQVKAKKAAPGGGGKKTFEVEGEKMALVAMGGEKIRQHCWKTIDKGTRWESPP